MAHTSLKAILIGTLLILGGIAFVLGDIYVPGFLWGASLGGIWSLLTPFLLIFLGALVLFAGLADVTGKTHSKKRETPRPRPPPPPPPP